MSLNPSLRKGKWQRVTIFLGRDTLSHYTWEYFCHFNDSFDSNCPVQRNKSANQPGVTILNHLGLLLISLSGNCNSKENDNVSDLYEIRGGSQTTPISFKVKSFKLMLDYFGSLKRGAWHRIISGAGQPGLAYKLCHCLAVTTPASCFTSLCLCFLICKKAPISQEYNED
jgi:hypothetical protein